MSNEYRKATTWELSTKPLERAIQKRDDARECCNALQAARHAHAAVHFAVDARCRGQVVDADNIDREDMLTVKTNALRAVQTAAGALQIAKRTLSELCRRIEGERDAVRPAALKARREREAREKLDVKRGPCATICGTYRTS